MIGSLSKLIALLMVLLLVGSTFVGGIIYFLRWVMTLFKANNDCILGILNLIKNQIFTMIKSSNDKEKAIDGIVKIIEDFQCNDEISKKYKG